ncbi:MAG: hypothetical protein KBD48_03115 [Candidatus Pacebacteria bacterium]|nr:hypothetical protein [Candidatus Paceibacterota bacterium]
MENSSKIQRIQTVCVFCSVETNANSKIITIAKEISRLISEKEWNLVVCGSNIEMIGLVLKETKIVNNKCLTTSILPKSLYSDEILEYSDVKIEIPINDKKYHNSVTPSDFFIFFYDEVYFLSKIESILIFAIKNKKPFSIFWENNPLDVFYSTQRVLKEHIKKEDWGKMGKVNFNIDNSPLSTIKEIESLQ